jgi:predicted O-methyltransferase YrrM
MTYTRDDRVLYSLRFSPPQLFSENTGNPFVFGLFDMIQELQEGGIQEAKMLEIGSYMGESTALFGMSNLFKQIHCIEPFSGGEPFSDQHDYDWKYVENQFLLNTRHYTNILHHREFSQDIHSSFADEYFDFIYIDANHSYESVKSDLINYLPKVKTGGYIGGHDYRFPQLAATEEPPFPGCVKAIDEVIQKPTRVFKDSSWIKRVDR